MKHTARKPPPPAETLRAEYQKTALHRMGIPFEQAIKSKAVRLVLGDTTEVKGQGSEVTPNNQGESGGTL